MTNPDPGPNLAVVYGHRRQGKSFLLDHLARRYGGLYHVAAEDDPRTALDSFATSVAEWLDLAVPLKFEDWKSGIETAMEQLTRRSAETGRPALMVIDEYSYLLSGTPALSSYIQNTFDRYKRDRRGVVRVVLCGSAFSLMANLLSGDKPLYGRAALSRLIGPFDHRVAARYWNATDRPTALSLHAIVGGVPGYRMLSEAIHPSTGFHSPRDLDEWVIATVLNPASMLFQEHDRLLREDPRISHRALYQGVLRQIAQGVTKPGKIAAALARDARSMKHPLDTLVDTGMVRRSEDLVFSGKNS
nr:ATP-binding protein [Microtetraspora fusca]